MRSNSVGCIVRLQVKCTRSGQGSTRGQGIPSRARSAQHRPARPTLPGPRAMSARSTPPTTLAARPRCGSFVCKTCGACALPRSPSLSLALACSLYRALQYLYRSLSFSGIACIYNMSLGNGGSGNGQETQASSQPQPLFLCRPTTVLRRPDLHCVELGRRAPCSGRAASVPGRRSAVLLLLAERVRRTGHPEAARIQLMVWRLWANAAGADLSGGSAVQRISVF